MNIQIANYHISDPSDISGSGTVSLIPSRKDAVHSGIFKVKLAVTFDPAAQDYPSGSVRIDIDLSDSVKGTARSTTIEQVNTHGKHTPTAVITGRCNVTTQDHQEAKGCRFWLLAADNKRDGANGTPDVVSFIVYDRKGKRLAYGTGPLESGDIKVAAKGL